jgi:hypothetical protein
MGSGQNDFPFVPIVLGNRASRLGSQKIVFPPSGVDLYACDRFFTAEAQRGAEVAQRFLRRKDRTMERTNDEGGFSFSLFLSFPLSLILLGVISASSRRLCGEISVFSAHSGKI